jgi:chromosome segregation ATPase
MSDSRVLRGLLSADLDEAGGGAPALESRGRGMWKTLSGLRKPLMAKVRQPSEEELADAEGQELLAIRLKQVQELAARTESYLQQEGAGPVAQPTTDTPSASGPGPVETSKPQPAEPSEPQLLTELIAAREQLKIAVEAHAAERAARETTGAELKGRRNESVADARMRAELQTELNGARAQLRQAIDAHNAELRACLEELKTAAEERAALEATLDTAQAKHREAADTYKADRTTWETTRDELKASLKRTSAELRQTIDAHASERATWADTLQQVNAAADSARADFSNAASAHQAELDARGKELREVADARAALDDSLKATQRERQQIVDAHEAERKAWTTTQQESQTLLRQKAEQYAADLADWETRHQQIHAALDAANAKLTETTDAHAFEQAAWASTRRELEAQANEFKAAAEAQGKTDETLRTTAEALRKTTDAYASDRGAWDMVRRELEADVNRVCAELAKAADARHDEFKAHKLELQKAADARTTLETQLTKIQAERQRAADAQASFEAAASEARAALATAAETHATELKTRERELQDAVDARKKLEAALAQADAERQKAADAHAADHATWDATRHQLEKDVNAARTAIVAFSEQASGLLRHLPGFSEPAANPQASVDVTDAAGPVSTDSPSRGKLVGLRNTSGRTRDRESA